MDLLELQRQIGEWGTNNFKDTYTATNQLLGIVEEVGELSHAHLKANQNIRGTKDEHFWSKVDAVGDIMIYLLSYCELQGIDLEDAVETTWAQVKERDWVKFPKNGRTE